MCIDDIRRLITRVSLGAPGLAGAFEGRIARDIRSRVTIIYLVTLVPELSARGKGETMGKLAEMFTQIEILCILQEAESPVIKTGLGRL